MVDSHGSFLSQGHSRLLQQFYIRSIHCSRDLKKFVALSPEACLDLKWWVNHLRHSNGKAILPSCPDLSIFSDASLQGWGAVCDALHQGHYIALGKADKSRHINELELLGALNALQTFTRESKDITVQLFLDNSTAVAYVNKGGGTRSRSLSVIASLIVEWCKSHNISILGSHLPGVLNSIADRESRSTLDASDWMLLPDRFKALQRI